MHFWIKHFFPGNKWHDFMKNIQIKLTFLIQYFIFIMLQLFETSRIKLIKLRITINNEDQVVIFHKKYLRSIQNYYSKVSFEDLNSFILHTCFHYEKHLWLVLYRYFQKKPFRVILEKNGSYSLDRILKKYLWRRSILMFLVRSLQIF